jgi:phage FluMu protein Com
MATRSIHCRFCGRDNTVAAEVIGQLCDYCGEPIFTAEVEAGIAATPKAKMDRTGDVLRVTCPHCDFVNEFPGVEGVHVFVCEACEKPGEVEETVN